MVVILVALGLAAFWYGKDAEAPAPESDSLIVLTTPKEGEVIASPLTLRGYARGFWFFEGDSPVVLVDWDGRIIAESYITARPDEGGTWMTEDFVPFEGVIEFEKPDTFADFAKRGAIILQKDNPSGISEYNDALEVQILFE